MFMSSDLRVRHERARIQHNCVREALLLYQRTSIDPIIIQQVQELRIETPRLPCRHVTTVCA